ncbi:DNA mismatch repair protein MutT [Cytophagales bacterium WSM2-2]|nr:DNA mismatch repair protein MutT [Cytophagales bacterium WSM2-2]
MMKRYSHTERYPVAVDCIIFGFDGREVKLLLIHRGFEPQKGKWSLMGGFVDEDESLDKAASRVLKDLTGLENVYMEQIYTFGEPSRDPVERTFSVVYFALIDIHQYEAQLTDRFRPEWFSLKKIPSLIFDHNRMVKLAREKLSYKASHHPILFELLPGKFTLPQLHSLYESVFDKKFDKRNFSRKALSDGLLVKLKDKEKSGSKKGAYYFKLNKRAYAAQFGVNVFPSGR